jgi:hypothetical protein
MEAVTALADVARLAVPAGVPVSIGPPTGHDIPTEYIAVAYGGDDRPGVQGSARSSDLANPGESGSELFGVWCTISTASGDERSDITGARASEIYGLIVSALRQPENRTLNGVLVGGGYADVGTYEWLFENGGQIATVFFQVMIDVRWTVWT